MSGAVGGAADAEPARPRHDLRMPVVGLAGWLAGIAVAVAGALAFVCLGLLGVLLVVLLVRRRAARGGSAGSRGESAWWRLAALALVAACAVAASAGLRTAAVEASPLTALAQEGATVDLVATVASDPRTVRRAMDGRAQVVVRLRAHEVAARGSQARLGGTVVLIGSTSWDAVAWGETLLVEGRLARSDEPDVAALVVGARAPVRIRGPDPWWRASGAVRASIREAVSHRPVEQATLVPALVVGDDDGLPVEVEEEFRTTGLTHLTAVSGTNLTLVVGALLLLARAVGVRGRWLGLVGLLGIVGFVLLARTEPSVLRAAAMGTVGLFAFGPDGRRRGLRALGVAVTALLLLVPGLATSAGFALSVLATAGIVLLGPPLTVALGRWLPWGLAEAVAIPTAAQLACTPLVAALSGEVSLVAVVANLLAGPAVGPATVLGLVAGLVGLVWGGLATLMGTLAGWCVGWIVLVADRGAALPGASIGWGSGGVAVATLAVLCVLVAVVLPRWATRRGPVVLSTVLALLVILGVPGRLVSAADGWPPAGWVLAACDVGQGDALAVNVGAGAAIVVDAGPDPGVVDACLDRLGVRAVPLLVLTHFHADHVDGLGGVLAGRDVGRIEVSPVPDPPDAVDEVARIASDAGVPVTVAPFGATRRIGSATFQVVHPTDGTAGAGANDGSVVLLVEVRGTTVLLTGDVEPPAQRELVRRLPGLDIDVLKVPHHGSAHQQSEWLTGLSPTVAVVPVGADNDYGHPSPDLLTTLERAGAAILRTDRMGDVAVIVDGAGRLGTATRR